MATYSYTGTLQTVTIATTGVYDIVAYGGQGGDSGGKGAEIGGDVSLTAGTKLTILVGGYGKYGVIASGGGGSFVVSGTTSSNTPLVIAGGGGATGSVAGTYYASEAGQTGTAGAAGRAASGQTFAGGTGGNGGSYEYISPVIISGGGGGLISPGSPSSSRVNHEGGYSFASGGKGGTIGPRRGAFGGAGVHIGGGGGGYSGGGGGYGGGGGGGSFLTSSLASSVNTVKVAGENGGAGKVVITLLTPPGIAGTVSSQQVASGKTIHPFSGVTITDADTAASDAITITLSGGGTLSGTGLSGGTNGVYTLAAGSAASVTTALQALVFTGMEAAGASATTSFSIAATTNDGAGTTTDTTTTVTTYGSPTITGTAAGQTAASGVPMHPFSGVTITDPDAAASQTLSISFYYYYEGLYRLYDGTLSGGAGLSGSNGNYTLTASSSTALTAALDSLTYTSSFTEPGESDNVTFTLSDSSSDGSPAATDNTTTLNVYGSPEIFGTGTFSDVISTVGFRPFQSAGISDPDASATDTVTISYTPGAGTLSGPDLTGSSGDYKLTDSASAITSDLTQLVYTPTVPNGQATTTTITLSVQSSDGTAPTTDNQTAIGAFGLPAITGTVTGQTAITGIAVNPFSNVVITDAGNASFQTLTISFTGSGTLTGAGQPDYYGNYTLTASTAAALTQALDAVSFTPTVAAGTQNTVTFTLTDESYPFYSTNSATTVIAYGVPTITGTVAGQAAAAGVGMQPFGTVTVTDPDPPASDTLSISFSGTAGTLSGTGLTGSNGSYTLTASSGTALTAALDAITFTPVEAAGASSSTSFTLADSSSDGLASASNGATSVIAYGAPVIGVPVQPPSVAAGNTVDPLAGVTLLDPDPGATETLTLTLSGGAGTLSGAGLAAGPNRTYTLTVAAGSAQAALQALVFTPGVAPDTTATTTIGIAGASSDGLSAATGTLSVTQYGAPSIAGTQTGQTATAGLPAPPFGGVSIADTAPGATDTVTITLSGAPGTLSGAGLTENQDGSYTLTGSAAGVTSQLRALQFTSSDVAAGTQATTTFTLTDSSSDGAAAAPATASVTETGTSAACYCPGTAILTPAGEVPVEALAIGDLVVTLDGCHEPITWIGRRSYAKAFVAGNPLMLPVCLKANALADGIPHRDLSVSAGHAIYIDGMLVPAWRLINGRSITQPEPPDRIDYLHIELGHHDILVAEGTPAESFLDDKCRGQFANHAEYARLYPEASAALPVPCVPRLEEGFHLQAIQQRLARRAGLPITPTVPGPLCGYIDVPGPAHVIGWAQEALAPEEPVSLDILAGGRRVARILANRFRQDLRDAGKGSGCHAFAFTLPPGVTGTIEVRRSGDHARLNLTEAALAAVA